MVITSCGDAYDELNVLFTIYVGAGTRVHIHEFIDAPYLPSPFESETE